LARANPEYVESKLGKLGKQIHLAANGLDDSPVLPPLSDTTKSISNGFTFRHNLLGRSEWRIGVDYLSEAIGAKLRKHNQKCATVAVTIKDEHLKTVQRQRRVSPPTDISREIADTAYNIITDEWKDSQPIRMITVTATNLIWKENVYEQMDLFGNENTIKREKNGKREIAIDEIRKKFGLESITRASIIDNDLGIGRKNKKDGNEFRCRLLFFIKIKRLLPWGTWVWGGSSAKRKPKSAG
jgi:DNA polymerase-4